MFRLGPVAAGALSAGALMAMITAFVVIRNVVSTGTADLEVDYAPVGVSFHRVPFDALVDWRLDKVSEALPAFLRSCDGLMARPASEPFNKTELISSPFLGDDLLAGRVGDWLPLCEEARRVEKGIYADERARSSAARDFLTSGFDPVAVARRSAPAATGRMAGQAPIDDPLGKATGYYEPTFRASLVKTERYSAPVYARPLDLVSVNLGDFDPTLKGRRVSGRVRDGALAPYPSRAEINDGALSRLASPIAYMDPDDLFFLQIQGSGRLAVRTAGEMREIRVGYDGANGRSYYAIGRALVESGEIALEDISMQAIRKWLREAEPEKARKLRERNPSYVFFRLIPSLPEPELGPVGAAGVQLTAMRSLAVDPVYYGFGAFIWVASRTKNDREEGRLLVAQDIGGAIKGPLRGDVFIGSGQEAARIAGEMNAPSSFVVLLPKTLAARFPEGPAKLARPEAP